MSSTTALVKELLDQKSTLKGRQSADVGDGGSQTVSQSDIRETVKEAVSEALAEHERAYHAAETPETTGDEVEMDDDGSSSGSSKKGLLLLILVVALLVRRRRSQGGSNDY